MMPRKKSDAWQAVYALVRRIPEGKVMNYGQIARLLERPLSARAVGWAMHSCPPGHPWHRVVSATGECSTDRLSSHTPGLQRALLESEGVRFGPSGRVDMDRYRWNPEEEERGNRK